MSNISTRPRPTAQLLSDIDDQPEDLTLHFDDANPLQENFDEKLQHAQSELEEIRRRADQLEREKSEYEILSEKRQRFIDGKADLVEKLNRALARLDRETHNSQVRIEQLQTTKDNFSRQLNVLESLAPESWSRGDLQGELNRAIGCIEDAADEYQRAAHLIRGTSQEAETNPQPHAPQGSQTAVPDRNFMFWLRAGFAFTLPAMGLYLVATLVARLFA